MAVYSLKEVWKKDKCQLFLTPEVALKGLNFIHLVPESRPNDQTNRKWWIADLVFNSILKGLTQQEVKVAEGTLAFGSLWRSNGWFVLGEAKGLIRWITFTCLAIVSRCFTETQRASNRGSKTVSEQGETLSGTRLVWEATALVQSGPVRLVLTQFCPSYRWWDLENRFPHKRKITVKMKRLFVSFNNHNSGTFLNL